MLALGLLHYDLRDYEKAQSYLHRVLDQGFYSASALYYLGMTRRSQSDDASAFEAFANVRSGGDFLPATAQMADILRLEKRLDEALTLVQERRANHPEQAQDFFLVESRVLQNADLNKKAIEVLSAGLDQFPDSIKMLYTRGLIYAQEDDIPAAEADYRRVLALESDNASTLNALGYTLTDKTDRYEEARGYIEAAYALRPEDPAILDSMGWVLYKLGDRKAALGYLQRAYERYPDPEIVAHLGEVLWQLGKKTEAKKTWRNSLKENPRSDILLKTIKRFGLNPDTL